MGKKKVVFNLVLFLFALIPIVTAQAVGTIVDFYNSYYGWIDFSVFLMVFVSAAMLYVGKTGKQDEKGATGLAMGLGLILAFALSMWEVTNGFTLASLGPLAFILLIVGIIIATVGWIFNKVKGDGKGNWLSKASLIFLILLILFLILAFMFFSPGTWGYFWDTMGSSWLWVVLWIVIIAVIVALLIYAIKTKGAAKTASAGGSLFKALTSPIWWPAKKLYQGGKWVWAKSQGQFLVYIDFNKEKPLFPLHFNKYRVLGYKRVYIVGRDQVIQARVYMHGVLDPDPAITWTVPGIPIADPHAKEITISIASLKYRNPVEKRTFQVEVTDKVTGKKARAKETILIAEGVKQHSFIRLIINGQRNQTPDMPGPEIVVNRGEVVKVGVEVTDHE
ncbi:hypothetical protein HZB00_03630, partial [Candidatus Woesearchaeota archaeon]|nr:hypothetical protein [Candidatus Woesearchaeota archaeon]